MEEAGAAVRHCNSAVVDYCQTNNNWTVSPDKRLESAVVVVVVAAAVVVEVPEWPEH